MKSLKKVFKVIIFFLLTISCDNDITSIPDNMTDEPEYRYPNNIGAENLTKNDGLAEVNIFDYDEINNVIYYINFTKVEEEGSKRRSNILRKYLNSGEIEYINPKYTDDLTIVRELPPTQFCSLDEYFTEIYYYDYIKYGYEPRDIFKAPLDDLQNPITLTDDPYARRPYKLVIHNKILFTSQKQPHFPHNEFYLMGMEGESPENPAERITFFTYEYDGNNNFEYFTVTPNERYIVFNNWRCLQYPEYPQYYCVNYVYDFERRELIMGLLIEPHNFAYLTDFTSDGRYVLCQYDAHAAHDECIGYIDFSEIINIYESSIDWEFRFIETEITPIIITEAPCWSPIFGDDDQYIYFCSEMEHRPNKGSDIFKYPFHP